MGEETDQTSGCEGAIDVEEADCVLEGTLLEGREGWRSSLGHGGGFLGDWSGRTGDGVEGKLLRCVEECGAVKELQELLELAAVLISTAILPADIAVLPKHHGDGSARLRYAIIWLHRIVSLERRHGEPIVKPRFDNQGNYQLRPWRRSIASEMKVTNLQHLVVVMSQTGVAQYQFLLVHFMGNYFYRPWTRKG